MPLEKTSALPIREPASPRHPWLHWGLVVTGLYVAVLLVLTLPVIGASFFSDALRSGFPFEIFAVWQYWVLIGILALSQFLLLRVPVRLAARRPVSRSAVWLPIVVAGFWFGCLVIGAFVSIAEAAKKFDNAEPWLVFGLPILSWIVWTIVFLRLTRGKDPKELIAQQSGGLLKGSIVELLVAVPCHIVARGRTDCCAGFFTFFGITMGVSVMLLSFGPAIFLLYHARWLRLRMAR